MEEVGLLRHCEYHTSHDVGTDQFDESHGSLCEVLGSEGDNRFSFVSNPVLRNFAKKQIQKVPG